MPVKMLEVVLVETGPKSRFYRVELFIWQINVVNEFNGLHLIILCKTISLIASFRNRLAEMLTVFACCLWNTWDGLWQQYYRNSDLISQHILFIGWSGASCSLIDDAVDYTSVNEIKQILWSCHDNYVFLFQYLSKQEIKDGIIRSITATGDWFAWKYLGEDTY